MIIGVDFDNTIVSYDGIFHRVAVERGVIPSSIAVSKTAVRDHLRRAGREDAWTEIQGHVYGARMAEAEIFPGVTDFFRKCDANGISVRIISHKTKVPYAGSRHDLHEAAHRWIERSHLFSSTGGLAPAGTVYFEPTKQEKLARIAATGCTHFIDDLPEFLSDPDFPAGTRRILFDPAGVHAANPGIERVTSWAEIDRLFYCASPGVRLDGDVAQATATIVAGLGFGAAGHLEPFGSGGNHRIFKVRSAGGRLFVVKSYFRGPGGALDRFERERRFYTFAARAAPESIPVAHGWDEAAAVGVFEMIDGSKLSAGAVGASEVAAALAFFRTINAARRSPEAQVLPPAAEACFTAEEHLRLVDGRVERLGQNFGGGPCEQEAREFVDTQIVPTWRRVRESAARRPKLRSLAQPLSLRERCVSPSDFGFHNCLRRGDGSFAFFDFEHAGWDDPAKTVCDFFCQPDIPVPWEHFDPFAAAVAGMLGAGDGACFVARCRALAPVYRLKWCCILLNEFCRDGRDRRMFAIGPAAIDDRKRRQLAAAQSALAALRETLKN